MAASNPILVSHRGGAAEAPENTLAAFRRALSMGILWFELDAQMTKDGELVVMHDNTVDRTTNGKGRVGDLSLEEIKRFDAGSWFDARYEGESVPTLREALELCASEGAGVLVELKSPHLYPGMESEVAALIGELRMQGASNIWCVSFDHEAIRRLHELDKGITLGYIYMPGIDIFSQPDDVAEVVCPFYLTAALFPHKITKAHKLGKRVFTWTVNDEAHMRKMAELGVDGIISDRPSLLLEVFGGSNGDTV